MSTILFIIVVIFALGESKITFNDHVYYYSGLIKQIQGSEMPWFWKGSLEEFKSMEEDDF